MYEEKIFQVEAVDGDQDLHIKLTREDMNRLNGDLFRGTMQVVDDAINKVDPAITADKIDQVVCHRNFLLEINLNSNIFKIPFLSITALVSQSPLKFISQILVGGSTRIPMVKELLTQKFGKDKLHMNVNQDEAVAQGAAILANKFNDVRKWTL